MCLPYLKEITINNIREEDIAHSDKVSSLAVLVSKALKLDEDFSLQVSIAGKIHDIGKRFIDQDILNKKGALTQDEYECVKKHVERSALIALEHGYKASIIKSVYYHHENFDGSGYPKGIKGLEIPFGARILRVCDFFDALTSDRVYRERMGIDDALEVMERNSFMLDETIYGALKKVLL